MGFEGKLNLVRVKVDAFRPCSLEEPDSNPTLTFTHKNWIPPGLSTGPARKCRNAYFSKNTDVIFLPVPVPGSLPVTSAVPVPGSLPVTSGACGGHYS